MSSTLMAAAADLRPALGHERLTSDVSLDELGDKLRIAVVEGVCSGDSDGIDVR